ncbi:ATP-binding protein [Paractinoplanes lichenicola]|uniref:AAA family ATPase n=1 Tax=Paractinoplanes lichenicola TaxID=2802976 RepID=A0ABS1VZY7_9ACTN|nr:AAA family ATPase [Actinoplanes lichenicola]MBL7260046.1 AAA family ATPase [Actinoplanes lichenicola]
MVAQLHPDDAHTPARWAWGALGSMVSRARPREDGGVLEVRLLGAFELRVGAEPVALISVRAQAVLAYLALGGGRPYGKTQLASALWPGSSERQARTNLRHVLHTLRASVPELDKHLHATPQTLTLDCANVDVAALSGGETVQELRAAADLYRGDLLEGWYDDWVLEARDECRRRMVTLLARLVPLLENGGGENQHRGHDQRVDAIRYAEQYRALDRLAEEPYRRLIRLYDAMGDRARAVRTFHECASVLRDELGVTPSEETLSLYAALVPKTVTASKPGRSVFVAREDERRRLTTLWRATTTAGLVLISGEPGIGKSRLAEEFRHWAARQGATTASARSYPAEGVLAYAPVVAWLRELGVGRLESAVLAPLLPEQDAVPAPPDPAARLRLFEALTRALRPPAGGLLLVADDLPAADAATCQFLHYLVRESPGPLLIVATARVAELDPGHPAHTLLDGLRALGRRTDLHLDRLDRDASAELAERLGHRLGAAEADRLHAETDGNPLFVVEALRAGRQPFPTPRVQAVLEARLRQLTVGARELAGIAAVAGSAVPVAVFGEGAAAGLDELWRRQILVTSGGDTYDFSHDKLREVAYGMLSPALRRHHHALIAQVLQKTPAVDTVAGRIAVHLLESGARDEAAGWFVRAAQAAQRVYADAEAAGLLLRAADLVRGQDRELAVLTLVPGPLSSAEGYASPRLRTVLDRALAIAGPAPAAPLLRAQAMAVLSRGEFQEALRHGAELRALGEDDDVLAVEGDFVQGVAAAWRADTVRASEHLSAALARYRPGNRTAHLLAYGQDPQVLCLVRLAHVRVRLGEVEEARRLRDRALDLAHSGGHPFTLGGALLFAALCDLDLGDRAKLRDHARELIGDRLEAAPIRIFAEALNGLLDGPDLSRIDAALSDPGRFAAPGVPAMLLRLRLEAARTLGLPDEERATAERLLADGVLIWDHEAQAILAGR